MKKTNEKTDQFLKELTELTKKHQIEICGNYDGAWLNDMVDDKSFCGELYFDRNKQEYVCC